MTAEVKITQITSQARTNGKPNTKGSTLLTKPVPIRIARNGTAASQRKLLIETPPTAPRRNAFAASSGSLVPRSDLCQASKRRFYDEGLRARPSGAPLRDRAAAGWMNLRAGRAIVAPMFLSFFAALREAHVPVTPREYLTLMQAMERDLADKSVDDFYHLSRALLVKDERNLDKFDVVFAATFKGALSLAAAVEQVELPEEWLRKLIERYLTPEERAELKAMGFEKLMETLRQRLAEQKGPSSGRLQMDRHGRNFPFRRLWRESGGRADRPGQGPTRQSDESLGPPRLQGSRRR
jgi:hypothetical protein